MKMRTLTPREQALIDTVMTMFAHPRGPAGVLEDDETGKGGVLVPIGAVDPFTVSEFDWQPPHIISVRDGEARIIAINAKHRGEGAFRWLVGSIRRAGLTPVVVCPIGEIMPAIMKKWGWVERVVGEGFDTKREWRAPK